ncbi:hypothetical protein SEA_XKCD426_64 [Streptomyces phage Xkcd426]|nr:hypothetical protein SEA_XKCD426_64 [Streptomyces phage Xkcd426]
MAKTTATAKTPTVAIARVLRSLGLKQGKDFSVSGEYRSAGGYRERIGTFVSLHNSAALDLVIERADDIEELVQQDGGWSFHVSICYTLRGARIVTIANFGSRVRQPKPGTEVPAAEVPAAEVPAAEAEPVIVVATEAEAIAVRAERQAERRTPAADLIGRSYSKQIERWSNGSPDDYTVTATASALVSGYTDPWTREQHAVGVRFTLHDSDTGRTVHTSLPLAEYRRHWVDAEGVTLVDPEDETAPVYNPAGARPEQTREERVAAVNRAFGRGTRVKGFDSSGKPRTGTVNGVDYGMVDRETHPNFGRIYLGVDWDAPDMPERGGKLRARPFADELTKI